MSTANADLIEKLRRHSRATPELREGAELPRVTESPPLPFLLKSDELAKALRLSDLEVSDLRRAGCPRIGRLWHLETVQSWIVAHLDFSAPFKAKRAAAMRARRAKVDNNAVTA
ncbi:MAG: hypothetical protein JSR82_23725 [Verrucomicrobia bacterium]|nr:hypothetical protein [Verrucomicrobiota bacterium]